MDLIKIDPELFIKKSHQINKFRKAIKDFNNENSMTVSICKNSPCLYHYLDYFEYEENIKHNKEPETYKLQDVLLFIENKKIISFRLFFVDAKICHREYKANERYETLYLNVMIHDFIKEAERHLIPIYQTLGTYDKETIKKVCINKD